MTIGKHTDRTDRPTPNTEHRGVQPRPLTIDHPMGMAPEPPVEEHVIHPRPVLVPVQITDASNDDLGLQLIEGGEQIIAELQGSAMHGRLQSLVVHHKHVLAEARTRFLRQPTESGDPSVSVGSDPDPIDQEETDDEGEDASVTDTDAEPTGSTRSTRSIPNIVALILMAISSLFWAPTPIHAQVVSQVTPVNNAAAASVTNGYAGAITNSSLLNIAISPGPVYCNGATSLIHNTSFALTANTVYNVFYRCSGDQLAVSTDFPVASDVMLGTVTCGATTCATIVDLRSLFKFPNSSDAVIPFGPGDCAWNATGTLGATTGLNLQNIGASLTSVNSISTTAAGATVDTLTCNIHIPYRTSTGKGAMVSDCTIYYGVQTTNLTSMGAPTLSSITMPAPGTAETPSTVAPVSLGAVTVTPVVGSANLTATTAGAFVSEKVALNTPVFLNTDQQTIVYSQAFNQSASAAQIVNTPGGNCHVVIQPL